MAFTKKIAGWVAGRIKGEQARKDTMRWMEKTGLGQILDIAGDIALTQGAIKGVSGLKGLMTGQKAATAAQTAATAKALPEGVTEVGRLASASPAESRALVAQMMAPTPAAGPVTPQIGMPKMPTSLPTPAARAAAPTTATFQPSAAGQAASRTVQSMAPAAAPAPVTPTLAARTAASMAPPAMAPAAPMRAMTTGAPAFQPSAAGQAASRAVSGMTPPAPSPMQAMVAPSAAPVGGGMTPQMAGTAQRMGGLQNVANANIAGGPGGFRGAMQFARENASWLGPAATATGNVIGSYIDRSVEEEKLKREQDARNRLAMLLMPMFQAQIGQAAPTFQPRG